MKNHFDIIIVGAGPAGLYAANHLADSNKSILILEKENSPGKKLLLSGSGQCNFTNIRPIEEFLTCYGEHGRFLKPALYTHDNIAAMDFFKANNISATVVEQNGKVFPKSKKSLTVLNVLLDNIKQENIVLQCNEPVLAIHNEEGRFYVKTRSHVWQSSKLLIATGGCSFPNTGSSGDGYKLATALGHSIITPKPGLTPFDISDFPFTDLAGTSFSDIPVSLFHDMKKIKTLSGPMVFTHKGLSGPVIHHLSRYAQKGDVLQLHFLESIDENVLRQKWNNLVSSHHDQSVISMLKNIPSTKALSDKLLSLLSINRLSLIAELGKKTLNTLFNNFYAHSMTISDVGNFDIAMVTVGGINLKEINSKTMESKICSNLYFAGEILDIDGDTGGYDLQACWSTGYLAAKSIKNNL